MLAQAWRMPKDEIGVAMLLKQIITTDTMAAIEKVGARPGQGVSSMFKFGTNYGVVIGCVAMLAVPFIFVTPYKWQQKTFDSNVSQQTTKEKSLYMARRLFPHVELRYKADHGKSDALLIALWLKYSQQKEK